MLRQAGFYPDTLGLGESDISGEIGGLGPLGLCLRGVQGIVLFACIYSMSFTHPATVFQ